MTPAGVHSTRFLWRLMAWFPLLLVSSGALAAGKGGEVVVVFNTSSAESRDVAYHYAARRGVPTNQIFGFALPEIEQISRADFRDKLQKPLLKALEDNRFFVFGRRPSGTNELPFVLESKIRYAVMCYGVPSRILKDPGLVEPGAEKVREELRRNEAAVDSELTLLPLFYQKLSLTGPLHNTLFATTNATRLHPTNGVLMVTRLDGPSAAIAKGLVDKAMQAETNGLWGRAYFDARGLTNGAYKVGDDWIRAAAGYARASGFESVLDERPEVLPLAFPLSQVALYAGWYEGNVAGAFAHTNIEFAPGAFAYHLHSFSAATLRVPWQFWVGPLLARGATATMGCVDEPYLEGTPNIAAFFWLFLRFDFTFGEAACAAQEALSWQTTSVGDPLYQPFLRPAQQWHEELARTKSKNLEWSFLKIININAARGAPVTEMIDFLERLPEARTSPVLQEKLGDLSYSRAKFTDAIEAYQQALKFELSPQQRIRVTLSLGKVLSMYQRKEQAYELYAKFLKDFPQYYDRPAILERLISLARDLKKNDEADKHALELKRLSSPAK
jgi:uncharacterized protein (TIGR03790 family)